MNDRIPAIYETACGMKFFIDENIAPQIGRALMILQQPLNYEEGVEVYNIREEYGKGATDEEWIPDIGNQDGIVISQDLNIHRTRKQCDLYRQYGMGPFS